MTRINTIGLTYDLRSEYLALGYSETDVAEFDSDAAIDGLAAAIEGLGYHLERIGNVRNLTARLVAGQRWDLVFNVAEGMGGRCREAQVPAILDAFSIPYTFADAMTCCITLDKACTKRLVAAAGLATPAFCCARTPGEVECCNLPYPRFIKPNGEGTGKGISTRSVVHNQTEYLALCQELFHDQLGPLLIEEFLPGREFTVGVLGTGDKARVLSVMEVHLLTSDPNAVYSYEIKETSESTATYTHMQEEPLTSRIVALAREAYTLLECRDAGRVDIRLDVHGRPSFIEVNPLAGLHPNHSDLPMLAAMVGIQYPQLIGAIIESAATRIPQSVS